MTGECLFKVGIDTGDDLLRSIKYARDAEYALAPTVSARACSIANLLAVFAGKRFA